MAYVRYEFYENGNTKIFEMKGMFLSGKVKLEDHHHKEKEQDSSQKAK